MVRETFTFILVRHLASWFARDPRRERDERDERDETLHGCPVTLWPVLLHVP